MIAQVYYLPDELQMNAVAKLNDATVVQIGDTDIEHRVRTTSMARRSWTVSYSALDADVVAEVELMYKVLGRHTSFLFAAPRLADYHTISDVDTGDGVTAEFQLRVIHVIGSISAEKNILHPRADTVVITVNGVVQTPITDYTVSETTGIVTFDAGAIPGPGTDIEAEFDYDTAVRFDAADLQTTVMIAKANEDPLHEIRQIQIIEVFNE